MNKSLQNVTKQKLITKIFIQGFLSNIMFIHGIKLNNNSVNNRENKSINNAKSQISFIGMAKLKSLDCLPQNLGKILKAEDVPCIYCDEIMLTPNVIRDFNRRGIFYKQSGRILKEFEPYIRYMHKIERSIFQKFSEMPESDNHTEFTDILKDLKPEAERILVKIQDKIFNDIFYLSQNTNKRTRPIIEELISLQKDLIKSEDVTIRFKRKRFLEELEDSLKFSHNKKLNRLIMSAAKKLPTSNDNINAFIVKYAPRTSDQIAFRLINAGVGSKEHIHPKSLHGKNDWTNYAIASTIENSARGNDPFFEVIERKPKVPDYIQHQANVLVELANNRIITDKNYLLCYKNAFFKESEGLIDIDIFGLKGLKYDDKGTPFLEESERFAEPKYYLQYLNSNLHRKISETEQAVVENKIRNLEKEIYKPKKESGKQKLSPKEEKQKRINKEFEGYMAFIPHSNRFKVKENKFKHPGPNRPYNK